MEEAITSQIEAPQGEPQEAAVEVRQEVTQEAQTQDAGQSEIPEKFKGKSLEDIVRSYENLESDHGRLRSSQKELEQKLNTVLYQSQQKGPTEEEVFRKEWEQDPAAAVYNQNQRTAARMAYMNSQNATAAFYNSAKKDKDNYPEFERLEPRMTELATQLAPMVAPQYLNSPATIDVLYKLAERDSLRENLSRARAVGSKEAETRRKEVKSAGFENPSPQSSSNIAPADMTLEQLEKQLGFAPQR